MPVSINKVKVKLKTETNQIGSAGRVSVIMPAAIKHLNCIHILVDKKGTISKTFGIITAFKPEKK